jgi:hypothetical protein
VYRTTPTERLFLAALLSEQVESDPALLAAVVELFASYNRELNAINISLLEMTRTWEPKLEEAKILNQARRAAGETLDRPKDPTRELYQQRREIGTRYIELLRDLLGLEVFSELEGASRYLPRPKPGSGDPNAKRSGGIRTSGTPSSPKERGKTSNGKLTGPTFGNVRPGAPLGGPKGHDD